MSWQVMGLVVKALPYLPLGPAAAAVLLAMADRSDDDGTDAFPSKAWLSSFTKWSPRAIQYGIKDLEVRGLLIRKPGRCWRGHTAHWRINLPQLEKGACGAPFLAVERRIKGAGGALKGAGGALKGAPGAPQPIPNQSLTHPRDRAVALEACADLASTEKNPAPVGAKEAEAEVAIPDVGDHPEQLRPAAKRVTRRCRNGTVKVTSWPWPKSFKITFAMGKVALDAGIIDAGAVFERFRLDALKHGREYADWDAAWRAFCLSEHQDAYRRQDAAPSGPPPGSGQAVEQHKRWEAERKAERQAPATQRGLFS